MGQGKFASQTLTFYHCTTQPTIKDRQLYIVDCALGAKSSTYDCLLCQVKAGRVGVVVWLAAAAVSCSELSTSTDDSMVGRQTPVNVTFTASLTYAEKLLLKKGRRMELPTSDVLLSTSRSCDSVLELGHHTSTDTDSRMVDNVAASSRAGALNYNNSNKGMCVCVCVCLCVTRLREMAYNVNNTVIVCYELTAESVSLNRSVQNVKCAIILYQV